MFWRYFNRQRTPPRRWGWQAGNKKDLHATSAPTSKVPRIPASTAAVNIVLRTANTVLRMQPEHAKQHEPLHPNLHSVNVGFTYAVLAIGNDLRPRA